MSEDDAKVQQLKVAFTACDVSRTGTLSFDEFFALLRKGNPKFDEEQAQTLFDMSDEDRSGCVDFDEFLEYIFNNRSLHRLFELESSASEEEAKQCLLDMPGDLRAAASMAVLDRGQKWRDLTWKERLAEVREIKESRAEDTFARKGGAPTKDASSSLMATKRAKDASKQREPTAEAEAAKPKKSAKKARAETTEIVDRRTRAATVDASSPGGMSMANLLGGGGVKPKAMAVNKFAIAEMSQEALVSYSLQEDDLSFAGDPAAKEDLRNFKEYLKTAESPLDTYNIERFIAKGTAGWVFLAEDKETGKKRALKLIRMTQARSGIKEWFCSKVLRTVNVKNVVFTDEIVKVVMKSQAPPVIKSQLENAGPVNFFLCMVQELMPWGTLEDLAKEGELSPEIMFRCLSDVAQTLTVMHANNLQHRDVKPENIMLQVENEDVAAAKLCDFGSAQVGDDAASCQDDIRRFGVTLFSVATGEGWTKNRLIREKHENLVSRLAESVADSEDPVMKKLPEVLERILSGSMSMADVAAVMEDLGDAYQD